MDGVPLSLGEGARRAGEGQNAVYGDEIGRAGDALRQTICQIRRVQAILGAGVEVVVPNPATVPTKIEGYAADLSSS